MKKIFIVASAILAFTASAAQIADDLIDKFLKFSVKDLLVENVFNEVWNSSKLYGMRPSGHKLYRSTRISSYTNLGLHKNDKELYIQGRTIIVARFKSYFFDGENLKDTYLAIQPRFKEEFSKLTEKEKDGLRQTLDQIKISFQLMLKKEQQEKYDGWLDIESLIDKNDTTRLAENWLVNNLSAEEIASRVKSGELNSPSDPHIAEQEAFKLYPDMTIAKFAGRRFKDGGEPLLRKYLEVIDLAIADTK